MLYVPCTDDKSKALEVVLQADQRETAGMT